MAREPAITFRGALRILGHYDRPWLDRLDKLLGGAILAAGAVPGISVLWGWVDQKNEATGLLRRALDAVSDRLTRTGGLARHELVVAAHTTMVLAAFFETLYEQLGSQYDEAEFTNGEKVMLGTGRWQREGEPLVRRLYASSVPSPSAIRGFEENVRNVEVWAVDRATSVGEFLQNLGLRNGVDLAPFAQAVGRRYRSDYLRLATEVPEFKVWADLGEHAATRTALTQLADLLTQTTSESAPRDLRALVGEINRAELTRPVIDVDIDGYGIDAVFPTAERIFLTPNFRRTRADRLAKLGDEDWWAETDSRQDLDLVLARHFSTPDSTRLPLLLLGHPGAGKSLLTKILAARLPESTYTVVRVPLRRVDADANVSAQIQQALALATNGRVSWPELADQSENVIRVVLLDGLDELLQATSNDRAGYLTDIVEFQRVEAAMGKPVAIVVTSRTLVADRVRVPEGTPVLKLEEFDDDQIVEWLSIWNEVNSSQPVPSDAVMAQEELARQPLLLLMLALYFADPDVAPEPALSTLELYERIFDTYARREVTKQAGRVLPETQLIEGIRIQLSRLSIAALGMINRGRQSVTEAELGADLAALGESAPVGERLLGEFFFVHAPEAMAGEVQRGYEFLHATFAEYLAATWVVDVLADVAEGSFGRRRFHDPDDELLFAVLSQQPLAVRRPTLNFIEDRLVTMDAAERGDVFQTLDLLILAHRNRRPATRYLDYRPQPPDMVRALAAYSANLVLLRVLAEGLELATLWPDEPNAWPATVSLWEAGLDAEGYRAMIAAIGNVDGRILPRNSVLETELNAARLRADGETERSLRFGHAVLNKVTYFHELESWKDYMLSSLLNVTVGHSLGHNLVDAPDSVSVETTAAVAEVAYGVLGLHCVRWNREETEDFLRNLMHLRAPGTPSPLPLALAEHINPGLVESLRAKPDEDWTTEWRTLLRAATQENLQQVDVAAAAEYLDKVVPRTWPFEDER